MSWNEPSARRLLRRLFDAAVAAADPICVLAKHLPEKPRGRCVVVGAGKAAASMAAAVEHAWPGVELSGLVVTTDGAARPGGRIEILQAAHPVPDARSELAARRILAAVQGLNAEDLVLVLLSGGGSALMALPAAGVTLADKQAATRHLLRSGATIAEINAVRRRLSAIKGGRLAQAARPARVVTLAISDVAGDDPAVIASGPTMPDPASRAEVLALVRHYRIALPQGVSAAFAAEAHDAADWETDFRLIATPAGSIVAAAMAAQEAGVEALLLGDAIEGESREVGRVMGGIALGCRVHGMPASAPVVLLSGGETTVTIGDGPAGQGGPNTEFLAGLALRLAGAAGIFALAADTDGIDGSTDVAGAIVTPSTLARARAAGLDPRALLEAHDSYALFAAQDLVRTGPTLTNVNDFRAILVA